MIAGLVLGALVLAAGAAAIDLGAARRAARAHDRWWPEGSGSTAGVPSGFARVLAAVEVDVAPARAWPWALRSAAAGGLVLVAWAPALAAVVVVGAIATAVAAPAIERRRAGRGYDAQVLGVVEVLSGSLASGCSLGQAVGVAAEVASPAGADLALVATRTATGSPLQAGLDAWGASRPGTGAGLVADALALAGTSGGSQVRALERVGATLRERAALGREVRALASQARISALVLVATPLAFATGVSLLDGRVARFLLATPAGWACVLVGLTLDAAGAGWMARLLRGWS